MQLFRTRLKDIADGGENLDKIVDLYTAAYEGSGYTAEQIWEECICDSLGDMNIFAHDADISDFAGSMIREIKSAAQTDTESRETRGPPQGKTSRETDVSKITLDDVKDLRSIGRKSINQFTSEDIKKAEPWARKFYAELGTKSPFFRAWFGDWRGYDRSKIKAVTVENIDLADVVMQNGEYTNPDTGWTIHAGKTLREETKHYARGEKVSVKALNDVKNILENAVLLDTEVSTPNSNNKKPGTAFMHKLYAPITYRGKQYISKLTVEEYFDEGSDSVKRKGYHLAAIKIEAAGGHFTENSADMSRSGTASIDSIADLHELVKTYDKDFSPKDVNPVLLNEDGTPKVFYHGTSEKFTIFDPAEMQEREGSFFFAENREDAEGYGPNVYEVYLQANKLADYDNQPLEFYRLRNKRKQVEWLKERGYDGWYADMDSGGWGELSVFNNTQIKSATDNIGAFDGENPDIRFSRELDFIDYLNENADLYDYIGNMDEGVAETNEAIKARRRIEKNLANRELLASALESVAMNETEKSILANYQGSLEAIAKAERRIADIDTELKKMSEDADDAYRTILERERLHLLSEVNYQDNMLLELEATTSFTRRHNFICAKRNIIARRAFLSHVPL